MFTIQHIMIVFSLLVGSGVSIKTCLTVRSAMKGETIDSDSKDNAIDELEGIDSDDEVISGILKWWNK